MVINDKEIDEYKRLYFNKGEHFRKNKLKKIKKEEQTKINGRKKYNYIIRKENIKMTKKKYKLKKEIKEELNYLVIDSLMILLVISFTYILFIINSMFF